MLQTPYGIRVHSVKDVPAEDFIKLYANHLKTANRFRLPPWADYVKTGISKELSPYDPDWLYIRAAAILRHLYFRPDQGVNSLRTLYGSKKRRGAAPGHHKKAAGGIIRYCLRQFQTLGLIQKGENGGRRLTSKGQQEINSIACQLAART